MATLRLAGNISSRDHERARSLVQSASRNPGHLNEREKLILAIFEAEFLGKDMKKSGELIREYVRRFPDDPEGYYRLAGVLMREGKGEEVLATYERLLSLDPNQAVAYNFLGYHFIGRHDFVKGEDYLKRYRFLAPDQANPYDSLGELYANTGRYDEAEEHLKRALQIRPDFFPAIGHLGTLEVGRGNPESAVSQFRRAAEVSEAWKDKLMFVGAAASALFDAGRPDDALAMLGEASTAPPALSPREDFYFRYHLIRSRAILLARAGRAAEAEAELALLPAVPSDLDRKGKEGLEKGLLGPQAALAGARGDFESAVRILRELVVEDDEKASGGFPYYPSGFRLRVHLADALSARKRPRGASARPRCQPALPRRRGDRPDRRACRRRRGPPLTWHRDARASESFDLRKKVLRLETLYDVSRALNVLREEQLLVDEIVARAVSLLDAERGFGVVFEEHGSPSVVATVGYPSFPGALAAASDPFVLDLCRARGPLSRTDETVLGSVAGTVAGRRSSSGTGSSASSSRSTGKPAGGPAPPSTRATGASSSRSPRSRRLRSTRSGSCARSRPTSTAFARRTAR
jgi:tetratricopeptide (TPR) repeat protein